MSNDSADAVDIADDDDNDDDNGDASVSDDVDDDDDGDDDDEDDDVDVMRGRMVRRYRTTVFPAPPSRRGGVNVSTKVARVDTTSLPTADNDAVT
jgi:hypothetical protein